MILVDFFQRFCPSEPIGKKKAHSDAYKHPKGTDDDLQISFSSEIVRRSRHPEKRVIIFKTYKLCKSTRKVFSYGAWTDPEY